MNRTVSLVAGVALICLGAFVLLRGASFTSQKEVVSVGDVKITAPQEQTIPTWAAGVAIVAGLVLVVSGVQKKA